MQYLKLTKEQRKIKKWRTKRNHILAKILERDRFISRADALRKANQMMNSH